MSKIAGTPPSGSQPPDNQFHVGKALGGLALGFFGIPIAAVISLLGVVIRGLGGEDKLHLSNAYTVTKDLSLRLMGLAQKTEAAIRQDSPLPQEPTGLSEFFRTAQTFTESPLSSTQGELLASASLRIVKDFLVYDMNEATKKQLPDLCKTFQRNISQQLNNKRSDTNAFLAKINAYLEENFVKLSERDIELCKDLLYKMLPPQLHPQLDQAINNALDVKQLTKLLEYDVMRMDPTQQATSVSNFCKILAKYIDIQGGKIYFADDHFYRLAKQAQKQFALIEDRPVFIKQLRELFESITDGESKTHLLFFLLPGSFSYLKETEPFKFYLGTL